MSPISTMIWLWWRRHRTGFSIIAAYAAVLSVAANTHALALTYLLVGASLLGFGMVYLFASFAGADTDIAQDGSTFPQYMLRLPVSTHTLIGWPMLGGALTMMCVWILLCRSVLQPLGLHVQELAPGAAIAVALVWTQTLCWLPISVGPIRIFSTLVILVGVTAFASLGSALGLSLPVWLSCDASLIATAYCIAVIGIGKARRGDFVVSRQRSHQSIQLTSVSRKPLFASALHAQMWFEWRRHGVSATLLALSIQLLFLPFLFFGKPIELGMLPPLMLMHTANQESVGIMVHPWAVIEVFLFAMTTIFVGAWSNTPEELRRQESAFYLCRPAPETQLIAAFVRIAVFRGFACWGIAAVFLLLSLLTPAENHGVHATLGALLGQTLSGQEWRLLIAVIVMALGLSFKAQVDGLYDRLSGSKWLQMFHAATSGFILIFFMSLLPTLAVLKPVLLRHLLEMAPTGIAGLAVAKTLCAALTLGQLRRLGLLPARNLTKIIALWSVCYFSLCALLLVLVGNVISQMQSLCAILLIMPGTRLGLAAITLNRNRHR